jgi:hypothetical protein
MMLTSFRGFLLSRSFAAFVHNPVSPPEKERRRWNLLLSFVVYP